MLGLFTSHSVPVIRVYRAIHQGSMQDNSKASSLFSSLFHINYSMTLDTPGNRKGMPDADHSQWTPLEYVAK